MNETLRASRVGSPATVTSYLAVGNLERERACKVLTPDPHGHRAEFIRLIGAAEGVARLQMTRR